MNIDNCDPKYKAIIERLRDKEEKRILFVCLGNICRSPAAEGVMKSIVNENNGKGWIIDSAGTGGWHVGELPDKRMRIHAGRRGLVLEHRCRRVTGSDFDDFDIIIGMDSMNIDDLKQMAHSPEAVGKILPMAVFIDTDYHCDHIPDPYYSGAEGFEHVLDLLENGCTNMFGLMNKD